MMLNQTFTNKIELCENANIHRNIYYENIKIKEVFEVENFRPSNKQRKYIFRRWIKTVVHKNKKFTRKIKQEIFLNDVGDFAMPIGLKLDILISNILKKPLS